MCDEEDGRANHKNVEVVPPPAKAGPCQLQKWQSCSDPPTHSCLREEDEAPVHLCSPSKPNGLQHVVTLTTCCKLNNMLLRLQHVVNLMLTDPAIACIAD